MDRTSDQLEQQLQRQVAGAVALGRRYRNKRLTLSRPNSNATRGKPHSKHTHTHTAG